MLPCATATNHVEMLHTPSSNPFRGNTLATLSSSTIVTAQDKQQAEHVFFRRTFLGTKVRPTDASSSTSNAATIVPCGSGILDGARLMP